MKKSISLGDGKSPSKILKEEIFFQVQNGIVGRIKNCHRPNVARGFSELSIFGL